MPKNGSTWFPGHQHLESSRSACNFVNHPFGFARGGRIPVFSLDKGNYDSEMCAYVINLERRPDRMNRLQQLLSSTNPTLLEHLERIDAVDGRNISLDSDEAAKVVEASALTRAKRAKRLGLYSIVHDSDNGLVNFDDHFTEGAIACAMSHHKALTQVAEHPSANWGLILEDDVSLVVPQVHREVSTILKQLPPDWTAVFLGYHNKYGCPHPRAVNATERWEAAACEKDQLFDVDSRDRDIICANCCKLITFKFITYKHTYITCDVI